MKAIMYHYVRKPDKNLPYFRYLSIEKFKKQLDYFQENYGFVSYEEFVSFLNNEIPFASIQNKVLLTFDDGFKDHFTNVFPELIKRNLFGIFYIPTAIYKRKKALDVHRIHYLLGKVGGKKLLDSLQTMITPSMISDKDFTLFKESTYTHQDNDHATELFKKSLNYYIKYEHRALLIDQLVDKFSNDDAIFQNLYVSEDELIQMDKKGMIIGSHGENHLVFSKLSKQEQSNEIDNSFDYLKRLLGETKIKTFCYPYGGLDTFTQETQSLLIDCKCQFSFSTDQQEITVSDFTSKPQSLPRYDCNQFPYGKANLG